MDAEAVRERARELPTDPGVYLFERGDGTVLYVGKAVDVRSRVRSYADPRSARIGRMVEQAEAVDVAVTDTETQALLLEANLIKRHQPRYNVRLKDDKSYPMVELTDHAFPRIRVTRDPESGSTAYGPFTDVARVQTVVKAIREVYGVRGCSDHTFANRARPCLDHDLGLCSAPCVAAVDEDTYLEDVTAVKRFFEGETGVLATPLEREMDAAADRAAFERAANFRDRLEAVHAFHGGGGAAVSADHDERHVDVLGVAVEGDTAIVARLHSEAGQLVERDQHRLDAPAAADRVAAILAAFVPQYYAERALPDALLLPEDHGDADVAAWLDREGVAVRVPGAGREATLVDLALKNAHRLSAETDELAALADAIALDGRPARIEGFDVSHAQGKAVVGSDVTFVDGAAEKADYRRKRLGEENDDYANVRRLLSWRAARAVEGRDDRPDPDLLLIDGGRGQLDAAREGLAAHDWDVPVVALAKRDEVVVTHDGEYDWPTDAPQLHVLQRVRDEAHRFAVQYHQGLRDEVATALDDVPGVGPELRKRLLTRFGSVDNVRSASREDLLDVPGVGSATADTIAEHL